MGNVTIHVTEPMIYCVKKCRQEKNNKNRLNLENVQTIQKQQQNHNSAAKFSSSLLYLTIVITSSDHNILLQGLKSTEK